MLNVGYDFRDQVQPNADRPWSIDPHLADFPGGVSSSSRPPGLLLRGKAYYGDLNNPLLVPGTTRLNVPVGGESLLGGSERKTINAIGRYDLTANLTAIVEGFYTARNSNQQLAPEPMDTAITGPKYPNGVLIPANTLNNPFPTAASWTTRRYEGGPRVYTQDVNTYRIRAGLEGKVSDYDWQAGFSYANSSATYRTQGEVNFTKFFQLLGVIPCSTADVAIGCHVANFKGERTLTRDEVNYFQFVNTRTNGTTQDFSYANVSGPLLGLSLPGGPVKFAVGAERREERLFDNPDAAIIGGDGPQSAANTRGSYHVVSAFGEVNAPILTDSPFAKMLNVNAAVRFDSYNNFGDATTWKVGMEYAPVEDIRFRGSASTAFRAPNVKELYGGIYQNSSSTVDPCSNVRGQVGRTSPRCVADLTAAGVNANTFVSALQQTSTYNGGNPNLNPENAQNLTAGFAFTPRFVPGLSVTADYWNVYIRNAITIFSAQTLLTSCYVTLAPAACAKIAPRQVGSGEVIRIDSTRLNFGFEKTSGVDFAVDYALPAKKLGLDRPGDFRFGGAASYLLHDYNQNPDFSTYDAAGTYLDGASNEPHWRSTFGIGYSEDNWSFGVTERLIGASTEQNTKLAGPPPYPRYVDAPDTWYTDLNASYSWRNMVFRVGVDNLFDKAPPYLQDPGNPSNPNGGYDYLGRFMYVKVQLRY